MIKKALRFARFIKNKICSYLIKKIKYKQNKKAYIKQCGNNTLFRYSAKDKYSIYNDFFKSAGSVDPHYFFQDIYVANDIYKKGFKRVYDIGSRLDGYISHLLSMDINVTMIDVRPMSIPIKNLEFIQGNATDLSNIEDNSLPVISCLHALEHFGLGRYNDPVDYNGWSKALTQMASKLAVDGVLYVSTPIAPKDVLKFNAHRIFNLCTIYKAMPDNIVLQSFIVISQSSPGSIVANDSYIYIAKLMFWSNFRKYHVL